MNRVLVLITLSDSGIETIRSTPELPKQEMQRLIQDINKKSGHKPLKQYHYFNNDDQDARP
ncbi:MAG: hypothetical protein MUC28_03205 [Planctomycetes bacterium]|nr:hypothetical protein [Planctomycetota bacterium]